MQRAYYWEDRLLWEATGVGMKVMQAREQSRVGLTDKATPQAALLYGPSQHRLGDYKALTIEV